MKKYVKPVLVYENFELSHSIANCSPAMNHSKDGCDYDSDELFGLIEPGETVFNSGSCTITYDAFKSVFEDICLQTGTEGFNLFTS